METTEAYLRKKSTRVVIIVPVDASNNQRQATKYASVIAVIALCIVNESRAAIVMSELDKTLRGNKDGSYSISHDLSGGTFEVSLVSPMTVYVIL
jgi:molecular chaperone DnaK (HSP70)